MKKKKINGLFAVNLILLSLLMLVSGFTKLFSSKISGVSAMLSNIALFSWAPMFWAVILIAGEIGSGLALLVRWKLRYTALIPVVVLTVAVLTTTIKWDNLGATNFGSLIFHLIALTNYLIVSVKYKK